MTLVHIKCCLPLLENLPTSITEHELSTYKLDLNKVTIKMNNNIPTETHPVEIHLVKYSCQHFLMCIVYLNKMYICKKHEKKLRKYHHYRKQVTEAQHVYLFPRLNNLSPQTCV